MKAYDMFFQSGSLNANPPDWLLQFVWIAVTILLLVCAALVVMVLARWLRLWRRSRGSFRGSWPFGLAPVDDVERHPGYVRDGENPLIHSCLSPQEEVALLDISNPSSGDLP